MGERKEPKARVPPREARGKSVVTEQEGESFTSIHQFYSYWRCYHKCEGVRCYVLEINECSQRKACLPMNHCLKCGLGRKAAPQNVAEGKRLSPPHTKYVTIYWKSLSLFKTSQLPFYIIMSVCQSNI